LRAKRSNPGRHVRFLDCFVALRAPRNDGQAYSSVREGSGSASTLTMVMTQAPTT
jgi:hypothetical protein